MSRASDAVSDDSVLNDVISDWVAREFGGRVTAVKRQARWRPTWFVDVERDGENRRSRCAW